MSIIVGIDEAGRGCLWGPVCCGAVILKQDLALTDFPKNLKDSKLLSRKQIKLMFKWVLENSLWVGAAMCHADIIDKYNILKSTMIAAHKCLDEIPQTLLQIYPHLEIKMDGNRFEPYKDWSHECIVGGDRLCREISAASIVAKHLRDSWVEFMCEQYPALNQYNLMSNKGYGTQMISLTKTLGLTPWHRKTFSPNHNLPINPDFAIVPTSPPSST